MGKHRIEKASVGLSEDSTYARRAAAEAWTHPADAMEAEAPAAPISSEGAAALRAMIELIVPPPTYGRVRRWQAGYHRLVVMVYMIAPEHFPGWSRKDLGRALGITQRPLAEHFAAVERALTRKSQGRRD